jgi:type II secretory pathway pseudopilin PulG
MGSNEITGGRLRNEQGFTYLGVLFLVVLMTIVAAAAVTLASFQDQRDKERELLFVGKEFSLGIERYRRAHGQAPEPYPLQLEDLLRDRNQLVTVRYLRKIYRDPMSGSQQWGLVRDPKGGIIGIYSLSLRRPIRTTPIPGDSVAFAKATTYQDWKFFARKETPTLVGYEGDAGVAITGLGGPAARMSAAAVPGDNSTDMLSANSPDGYPGSASTPVISNSQAPVPARSGSRAGAVTNYVPGQAYPTNSNGVYDDQHPAPPPPPPVTTDFGE